MRRANCLPPPCPGPMTSLLDYNAPCSGEYDAAGIFGPMDAMPTGHPIATRCAPGGVLPNRSQGGPVGFARTAAATLIPGWEPDNGCAPQCPAPIVPLVADSTGRPIPPNGGRLPPPVRMPVLPPPVMVAPRPPNGGGTNGGGGYRPWSPPRPVPGPTRLPVPIPRQPPPPRMMPGPVTRTPPTISTHRLPQNPRLYAQPIRPSISRLVPARIGARPRTPTINGFGDLPYSGGGIFDVPGGRSAGESVPFQRLAPPVMMPPECPRPAPPACPGASYAAPMITMPGHQPCPAPVRTCANVPAYDVVVPAPSRGCDGFGWW